MRYIKKGFTLIELLIVIALLGALAVGLLAALDPFEQLKKGTDTGIRNTVSELHGAVIRYYAIKSAMPWDSDPDNITDNDLQTANLQDSTVEQAVQRIIDTGELKQDFLELVGNNRGRVFIGGTEKTVYVCFHPESRSFRAEQNTKWLVDSTSISINPECPTASGVDSNGIDCDWCVQ